MTSCSPRSQHDDVSFFLGRREPLRTRRSETIDLANDAIFHRENIEIQQVAKPVTAKFEIAEKLSAMDFSELVDRFHLDNQALLDE